MALQVFFRQCQKAFKGQATDKIEDVKEAILHLTPDDFQFHKHKVAVRHPTCIEVYQSGQFDINLFSVPPGQRLPLHSHPEMTVLGRLLKGSAQVVSYDLLQPLTGNQRDNDSGHLQKAVLRRRAVITSDPDPDQLLVVQPWKENIHLIHAIEHCLLLDVLAPPYLHGHRDCVYFTHREDIHIDDTNEAWLQVTEPYHYTCNGIPYIGPSLEAPVPEIE